jgi:hypothetical protein
LATTLLPQFMQRVECGHSLRIVKCLPIIHGFPTIWPDIDVCGLLGFPKGKPGPAVISRIASKRRRLLLCIHLSRQRLAALCCSFFQPLPTQLAPNGISISFRATRIRLRIGRRRRFQWARTCMGCNQRD